MFKKKESVKKLPFRQNKILQLTHAVEAGEFEYSESVYAVVIPVLNQPLSSNQYYIIDARGTRKGNVRYAASFYITPPGLMVRELGILKWLCL